jgi:pimeloyl-ACP methyl ester carboxylesterase
MSGFVGADVDQLDSLAVRLERQAAAYREISASSTLALMVATWTGADIERVRSEWNRISKPAILRVSDELSRLAGEIRLQAAQQRETSNAASGRTASDSSGVVNDHVPRVTPKDGPGDMRGLVAGVKPFTGAELFSLTEVVGPDGVTRLIVTIPGTHGDLLDPGGWGQLGGWGEDPAIWLSQHSAIRDRIAAELKSRLAAYPGVEVMLVGHSQGGMLAQSIADDPAFHIREVVTVGSPVMTEDHGYGGANITRLEHNSDWVVNITDGAAVIRNELTGHGAIAGAVQQMFGVDGPAHGADVTFQGGSPFEGMTFGDGIAHDLNVGDYDWLADRFDESSDPTFVAARDRMDSFVGGSIVGFEFVK